MSGVNTMADHPPELLRELLAAVSRSFYLTVRVLPPPVRRPVGVAYLLARATDTIADTTLLPPSQRLAALAALRQRILGDQPDFEVPEAALQEQTPSAERTLLLRLPEALGLLDQLPEEDRAEIRQVLRLITSGQELDLRRFGEASKERIAALATDEELEDYTYRVAGCVGEFWTRLCRRHLFPSRPMDEKLLLARAVRFGKGLQLVNILRDLPRDLGQGRCYLPSSPLAEVGLRPSDLLDPAHMPRLLPVYSRYVDLAASHLAAGWSYTNMLPRSQVRLRLACAWPILIGLRTLERLRTNNGLDPRCRVKISRREVRLLVLQTLWRWPWTSAWQRLFERTRP